MTLIIFYCLFLSEIDNLSLKFIQNENIIMKSITKVRATFCILLIIIVQSCKHEINFGQIEKEVSIGQIMST